MTDSHHGLLLGLLLAIGAGTGFWFTVSDCAVLDAMFRLSELQHASFSFMVACSPYVTAYKQMIE